MAMSTDDLASREDQPNDVAGLFVMKAAMLSTKASVVEDTSDVEVGGEWMSVVAPSLGGWRRPRWLCYHVRFRAIMTLNSEML